MLHIYIHFSAVFDFKIFIFQSVDVYCIGLDVPKNTLHYSIWASHVGGWAEVSRTLGARTKLWEQLQVIKRDMGIEFMELSEMRHINVEGGKGDMNIGFQGFGGASNARSSVNRQNNKDVERVSTGATSSTNSILIVDKAAV